MILIIEEKLVINSTVVRKNVVINAPRLIIAYAANCMNASTSNASLHILGSNPFFNTRFFFLKPNHRIAVVKKIASRVASCTTPVEIMVTDRISNEMPDCCSSNPATATRGSRI